MRLTAALDALGFPAHGLDRTRKLAVELAVDPSTATELLRGHALPDYLQLQALCQLANRQPGYFLDEQLQFFPEGTSLVKPVGPGEDLVVRLPSDMTECAPTSHGLIYHRAKTPHGYGIEAGDYVIAIAPGEREQARLNLLYLFMGPDGFEVRKCVEVSASRAIFTSSRRSTVPFILPARAHATEDDNSIDVSLILATLRVGSALHLHT